MEAQCRAGRAYQQHARGGTSGGNVPVDIHPGERVHEMEGGKVEAEVAWLVRWRATRDGSVLWPRRAGKTRRQRDLLDEHAQGELRA
jgi:hypothetical protein